MLPVRLLLLQSCFKTIRCFLFHLKSSFRSQGIQIFVFSSFFLFLPVSHCFRAWSKINFKVYDVINCQNKNLITHLVWYLGKKKGITMKLCPWEKSCQNCALVPDPFFILVNNPKQLLLARNFFKNRIFGKGIIKNL